MEVGAVLDVLVDVVDDVFGKRRSENAAIAEGAVAEFGAALAPGDDLVAGEDFHTFGDEVFFARRVFVNDFAVVEYGFDVLGAEIRTERQRFQSGAAGFSG